ncbi:MAG: GNAT family N-acetyltransferase [Deltaproteobacteria bacterium]|nr:GNAT family N-acetyltransferase [Deltaproteobacteria bacterium]
MSIEIREMTLEDLPEVYDLGERVFTAEAWPSLHRTWDEFDLALAFASDSESCLVAENEKGRIVGFVLGTLLEKRGGPWAYGWLTWIAVRPRSRKERVGRRLLDALTEIFIEQGARMMLVDTDPDNVTAVRFFEDAGFGNPQAHVYLSRNLKTHPSYARRRAEKEQKGARRGRKPPR